MKSERACGICGSHSLSHVLTRRNVPVLQNVQLRTRRAAAEFPRGTIGLTLCRRCGFLFNRSFDPGKLAYRLGYRNTQMYSGVFREYFNETVEYLRRAGRIRNARIVEIGCGEGAMLRALIGPRSDHNTGLGFDPAYRGPGTAASGRLRFAKRLFGIKPEKLAADVVVCRQVIEHLPDPIGFLRRLHAALQGNRRPRVFFETSCSEWILRNRVFHDIYYEHCSLFGSQTYRIAFQLAGFHVRRTWHAFGGAYLWIEAEWRDSLRAPVFPSRPRTAAQAKSFARAARRFMSRHRSWLRGLARSGKTALWGAGAKGVTLAHLLDPRRELIECVVDLNPGKQGQFLAATGHPIVSPEVLPKRGIANVIVTNPNYVREIGQQLARFRKRPSLFTL